MKISPILFFVCLGWITLEMVVGEGTEETPQLENYDIVQIEHKRVARAPRFSRTFFGNIRAKSQHSGGPSVWRRKKAGSKGSGKKKSNFGGDDNGTGGNAGSNGSGSNRRNGGNGGGSSNGNGGNGGNGKKNGKKIKDEKNIKDENRDIDPNNKKVEDESKPKEVDGNVLVKKEKPVVEGNVKEEIDEIRRPFDPRVHGGLKLNGAAGTPRTRGQGEWKTVSPLNGQGDHDHWFAFKRKLDPVTKAPKHVKGKPWKGPTSPPGFKKISVEPTTLPKKNGKNGKNGGSDSNNKNGKSKKNGDNNENNGSNDNGNGEP